MVKIITTVMKGLDLRNYVYEARLKGIQGKRKNFQKNFIKPIDKTRDLLYIIDRKR